MIGKLKQVSKYAGIRIEGDDNWYNPTKEVKEDYLKKIEALKTCIGQDIEIDIDENGDYTSIEVSKIDEDIQAATEQGVYPGAEKKPDKLGETESGVPTGALHVKEKKENWKEKIPAGYIIKLQGKEYITHPGLLWMAHEMGIKSIQTELLTKPEEDVAVVKAIVVMQTGQNLARTFSGIGDAGKTTLNDKMFPHRIRMAETRAVNRALRFATNIGMTSIEELNEEK